MLYILYVFIEKYNILFIIVNKLKFCVYLLEYVLVMFNVVVYDKYDRYVYLLIVKL